MKFQTSRWNQRPIQTWTWRCCLAAITLVGVLAMRPAAAQQVQEKRRAVLVDIQEELRQQGNDGNAGNRFEMTPETLDQWVFNGSPDVARKNYQALIKLEIAHIDAVCGLSPKQKRMLELAGAGELQRIRESLAVLHARFAGRTYDQDKVGEIFQEIQPFRTLAQRPPLDPESLLSKLLQTTLDASQAEKFAHWKEARARVKLRVQIDSAVAAIEQQVPLRHAQRQALIQLLQAEVRPLGKPNDGQNVSMPQSTIILTQMNGIAPEAFQEFLEDAQWEPLQAVFSRYRGNFRMLQQRGMFGEKADPAAAAEAEHEEASR